MNKIIRFLGIIDKLSTKAVLYIIAAVLVCILIAAVWLWNTTKDDTLSFFSDDKIDSTPTMIEQMKEIGEWEFLAISDEELVDTVRKGFFSDDELVRIYYGTVRLGINFKDCSENWIDDSSDTVKVTLPKVRLLDDNFIDEARTKSFFETGKWSNADRKAMYQRAKQMMLRRCVTKENLKTATENAHEQVTKMLQQMTEKPVRIEEFKN